MDIKQKINDILQDAEQFTANNLDELEDFRIKYLSKKGIVSGLFEEFKHVPKEQKKDIGQSLNILKTKLNELISVHKEKL